MNFELGEQIGKGNTGLIYRAKQVGLDRQLAVKFIHPALVSDEEAAKQLLKEATLCANLNHANIVRVHDAGQEDSGRVFIVMELLAGESLQSRLSRGKVPEKMAVEITKQVLAGLVAAHRQGSIHRDLKPANIFLTTSGVVKILDFGIAKALGTNQTSGIGLHGTPEYMSPELAEGKKPDNRSDLYSLGIILFEMLTGAAPFTAETPMGVLYKQVHERIPELPRGLPPTVHATLVSLLRKSPKHRPQSAEQAMEMLEGTVAVKSKPPAPAPKSLQTTINEIQAAAAAQAAPPAKSSKPGGLVGKIAIGVAVILVAAIMAVAGKTFAPKVEDFIVARIPLNLSLRVTTGQKFQVLRQQELHIGKYKFVVTDDGQYTAKTVQKAPIEVLWSTKREKSVIHQDAWKKSLNFTASSSSTWPNKAGTKDSGWALSPLTVNATTVKNGEGGTTKSGLQWKWDSVITEGDHKYGKITFANLPTSNILLDAKALDAITGRMQSVKKNSDWSFPASGWKMTKIEDKIDLLTGIPTSIEFEQARPDGAELKTVITMTPIGK